MGRDCEENEEISWKEIAVLMEEEFREEPKTRMPVFHVAPVVYSEPWSSWAYVCGRVSERRSVREARGRRSAPWGIPTHI